MILLQDELQRLYPRALPGYLIALERNLRLLDQHCITTEPLALCHFLAQMAHETGEFTIVSESGSYSAERLREIFPRYFTPAQAKVYARKPAAILSRAYANRLGNGGEASGDGWKYRGRGPLQRTGKAAYARSGKRLGVDLVADPDALARDFDLSLRDALLYWSDLDLGRVARTGATHEAVLKVSRGVNCGNPNITIQPNGFADRKAQFDKLWKVYGQSFVAVRLDPAADGILEDGEEGDVVAELQLALAALGYPVGQADGVFGERTRAAVAAFQMREDLRDTPGKWRVEWKAQLATAKPFLDTARQAATVADVAASGTMPVGLLLTLRKVVAAVAAFLGLDTAIDQTGVQLPQTLTGLKQVIDPLAGNLSWLAGSRWVLGLVGCLAVWLLLGWAIDQMVKAYRGFRAGTA